MENPKYYPDLTVVSFRKYFPALSSQLKVLAILLFSVCVCVCVFSSKENLCNMNM